MLFGDEAARPIVGNFDPPVTLGGAHSFGTAVYTNPRTATDVDNDGLVTPQIGVSELVVRKGNPAAQIRIGALPELHGVPRRIVRQVTGRLVVYLQVIDGIQRDCLDIIRHRQHSIRITVKADDRHPIERLPQFAHKGSCGVLDIFQSPEPALKAESWLFLLRTKRHPWSLKPK